MFIVLLMPGPLLRQGFKLYTSSYLHNYEDPRDTIIKMVFIKEESEAMKIEETFRVKHEDTEEQTKMAFIKEENEDVKIEETFRVKHEDTEEQTEPVLFFEKNQNCEQFLSFGPENSSGATRDQAL
ncbi:hypothetical protein cypCar_00039844 [Cyprinus carpio]|nr:hypothetical protein cypCar_00039844 [Cyprinus carpio]